MAVTQGLGEGECEGEGEGLPLALAAPLALPGRAPPPAPAALALPLTLGAGLGECEGRGEALTLGVSVSSSSPGEPLGVMEGVKEAEAQVVALPRPAVEVGEALPQRLALGVGVTVAQGVGEGLRGALRVARRPVGVGVAQAVALPAAGCREREGGALGVAAWGGGEGDGRAEGLPPAAPPSPPLVALPV